MNYVIAVITVIVVIIAVRFVLKKNVRTKVPDEVGPKPDEGDYTSEKPVGEPESKETIDVVSSYEKKPRRQSKKKN